MRTGTISRKTNETSIDVTVNLDGTGVYAISTGIGFLDHMLEQLSRHSLIDLAVTAKGDLHIDQHHTTEDTGIAIGEAVLAALGDKRGITRIEVVRTHPCPSHLCESINAVFHRCKRRYRFVWDNKRRHGQPYTETEERLSSPSSFVVRYRER